LGAVILPAYDQFHCLETFREIAFPVAAQLDFAVAGEQVIQPLEFAAEFAASSSSRQLTGFPEVFAVAIPAVVEQDGDRAIAVQRDRVLFS